MKSVSRRRELRYQTVDELRNDIERFLEYRSVSVKDDSVWELIIKIVKRNKTASITAAVFSAIFLLVMTLALILNVGERRRTEAAFERYRSSEMQRSALIARDFYERQRAWVPVLHEDFSDEGWKDRWNIIYGKYITENFATRFSVAAPQCSLVDGMLCIRDGMPQALIAKESCVGDVAIEFDCIQPGPRQGDLSCIIGAVRNSEPYMMAWSGYTLQFGAYDNTRNLVTRNSETIHRDGGRFIERGRRYRVRGEREGGSLRLIVDTDTLFNVIDPYPLYGSHRDAVGILGYVSEQLIDNITIYRKGAAQKEDLLDIAERYLHQDSLRLARILYQQVWEGTIDGARSARAREGLTRVADRENIYRNLHNYNRLLHKAWPGRASFGINEDGILLHIGPQFAVPSLRPLAGIPITSLSLGQGPLDRSLAPLQGMPLKYLSFVNSEVDDFGPLQGMPLKRLIAACSVRELSPLRGMPLSSLGLAAAPISDLTPLAGMRLSTLNLQLTMVKDITPLSGQPLKELYLDHTLVEDLSSLENMNLGILGLNGTRITTLENLRASGLFELHCKGTDIVDLSPLSGCPLRQLRAAETQIRSLSPLSKTPISMLDVENSEISDLSPLAKASLTELNINFTRVSSLKPIRTMQLRDLRVYGIPISEEHGDVVSQFPLRSLEADLSDTLIRRYVSENESLHTVNGFRSIYIRRVLDLYKPNQQRHPDPAMFRRLAVTAGKKKYAAIPIRLSWAEAESFSRQAGGILASPATSEESSALNQFLRYIGYDGGTILMGLIVSPAGVPTGWVSGAPLAREFWRTDSERERCRVNAGRGQVFFATGELWMFIRGSAPAYFVIEWTN